MKNIRDFLKTKSQREQEKRIEKEALDLLILVRQIAKQHQEYMGGNYE